MDLTSSQQQKAKQGQVEQAKVGRLVISEICGEVSCFAWTAFYVELAYKLVRLDSQGVNLTCPIDRVLNQTIPTVWPKGHLDLVLNPNKWIEPFSVFALFNLPMSQQVRIKLLKNLAQEFELKSPVPLSAECCPCEVSLDEVPHWASGWVAVAYAALKSDDGENTQAQVDAHNSTRSSPHALAQTTNLESSDSKEIKEGVTGECAKVAATIEASSVQAQTDLDSDVEGEFLFVFIEAVNLINSLLRSDKTIDRPFYWVLSSISVRTLSKILHWVNPDKFISLDATTLNFIRTPEHMPDKVNKLIASLDFAHDLSLEDYWELSACCRTELRKANFCYKTLPELSFIAKLCFAQDQARNQAQGAQKESVIQSSQETPTPHAQVVQVSQATLVEQLPLFQHADTQAVESKAEPEMAKSDKSEASPKTTPEVIPTTIPEAITDVEYESYTAEDFLGEVFITEADFRQLVRLVESKKNVILQGSLGVGKTFIAQRLAFAMLGIKDRSRVQIVQFHQSYSYEDFIVGFRPAENSFELKYGPFYQFCKRAEQDLGRKYFFIIDEINRGNLSKIFGELFMLIEKDKRGLELPLLYAENEYFAVPENVYIIGMMNTADRSLALLDYALRRRFAFFDIVPAFSSVGFRNYCSAKGNTQLEGLITELERLNKAISVDESLGSGFCIGHSYFCTDEPIDDEWLSSVIKYEIVPLLKEYWFDEPDKVLLWEQRLHKAIK